MLTPKIFAGEVLSKCWRKSFRFKHKIYNCYILIITSGAFASILIVFILLLVSVWFMLVHVGQSCFHKSGTPATSESRKSTTPHTCKPTNTKTWPGGMRARLQRVEHNTQILQPSFLKFLPKSSCQFTHQKLRPGYITPQLVPSRPPKVRHGNTLVLPSRHLFDLVVNVC